MGDQRHEGRQQVLVGVAAGSCPTVPMSSPPRRRFLQTLAAASALSPLARRAGAADAAFGAGPFKLGTVTYNLAKDWDVPTLIKNCEANGFEAVELRTT